MPAVLKIIFKMRHRYPFFSAPFSGNKERSGSWLCIFCSPQTGGKDKDMYFNQVEFGKRLQECRKLKELTQEELAELVGVEKQHISRIERGVTACSIDLLPVLSVTLQVSTDYLLMGKSIDKELTRTQLLSVISQLTMITQGL